MEENKAIVCNFLEIAARKGRTLLELCAPGFTAHIGGLPAMDLQVFQKYQLNYFAGFSEKHILSTKKVKTTCSFYPLIDPLLKESRKGGLYE